MGKGKRHKDLQSLNVIPLVHVDTEIQEKFQNVNLEMWRKKHHVINVSGVPYAISLKHSDLHFPRYSSGQLMQKLDLNMGDNVISYFLLVVLIIIFCSSSQVTL